MKSVLNCLRARVLDAFHERLGERKPFAVSAVVDDVLEAMYELPTDPEQARFARDLVALLVDDHSRVCIDPTGQPHRNEQVFAWLVEATNEDMTQTERQADADEQKAKAEALRDYAKRRFTSH